MVGSRSNGSMGDNQVEGWGGYRIDQVAEISLSSPLSLATLPNLVLILCGANDVYQNHLSGMSDRMAQWIDNIFNAVPGTTIVVSTLPPNDNPANAAVMDIFNHNLTGVVSSRASVGKKIFLVDCNSTVSNHA